MGEKPGEQRINQVATLVALVLLVCTNSHLFAQISDAPQAEDKSHYIRAEETPFVSARAAGMSNAISTIADSTEAPFFNPAGIGGAAGVKPTSKNWVRELDFPYVGAAANENMIKLYNKYDKSPVKTNRAFAPELLESEAGKPQYGRISAFPNINIGRIVVGPIVDEQVASLSRGAGTNQVATHYRSTSGVGGGLSMADDKGRVAIGAFATVLDRKDVVGDLDFLKVVDQETRDDEINGKTIKSQGTAVHGGFTWLIKDNRWDPRVSGVLRDAGNTRYKVSEAQPGTGDIVVQQDATLGMSISPALGSAGVWHLVVEGTKLSDRKVMGNKKFRIGSEFVLGVNKGKPTFSLRTGYNLAGVSAGIGIDIGLISLQYASQAEDIGVDEKHVVDRRNVAVVAINVAEY